MASPYTLGIWRPKEGRSEQFVDAWTEFADWTVANVEGAGWGKLLRDLADDHRYISVGPWESLEAIEHWRSLDGWHERVAGLRELLDGFEPMTLEAVVERG